MSYTKDEYDFLLKLRKRPRTWEQLRKHKKQLSDGDMNIMFSDLDGLYYVEDDRPVPEGKIVLNQKGRTIAQAEFDRRFDMYLTRFASLAALVISGASAVVSAIALLQT